MSSLLRLLFTAVSAISYTVGNVGTLGDGQIARGDDQRDAFGLIETSEEVHDVAAGVAAQLADRPRKPGLLRATPKGLVQASGVVAVQIQGDVGEAQLSQPGDDPWSQIPGG